MTPLIIIGSFGHFIDGIRVELWGPENTSFSHVLWDANNVSHVFKTLLAVGGYPTKYK
jgi:hypothetical protein